MKTLFIDTETQHLPDMNKRARDPSQPHIVQFAGIQYINGVESASVCHLVHPDGWTIPPETTAIHGITNEMAAANGIVEQHIAERFLSLMRDSDLLVGHNISFDKFIMRIACRRFDLITDQHDAWWKAFPTFCTMREMTNICQIPGARFGYKWPKLHEAYSHAFGKSLEGAHDALVDVRACSELYFWLKGLP